jgi:ACR3 family arsenite transporter
VLIWLMIIPMLVKIDFAALAQVKEHWRGIGVTLFINWAVKPFSMALLAWLFIGWLFRAYLPADQINSYIAGLILLAAAPCTAMVFVWSNLSDGEPHFTLSQVALNDVIMVFAFAPIVGLLLGLSAITVPWETLLLSVVLYIVVPVIIAQIVRRSVLATGGKQALTRLLSVLQPIFARGVACHAGSSIRLSGRADSCPTADHRHAGRADFDPGLFQRRAGLHPQSSGRRGALCCRAVSAHWRQQFLRIGGCRGDQFFGFNSGAALATVVGVLIEVPVMLSVVKIVNNTRAWYEAGDTVRQRIASERAGG